MAIVRARQLTIITDLLQEAENKCRRMRIAGNDADAITHLKGNLKAGFDEAKSVERTAVRAREAEEDARAEGKRAYSRGRYVAKIPAAIDDGPSLAELEEALGLPPVALEYAAGPPPALLALEDGDVGVVAPVPPSDAGDTEIDADDDDMNAHTLIMGDEKVALISELDNCDIDKSTSAGGSSASSHYSPGSSPGPSLFECTPEPNPTPPLPSSSSADDEAAPKRAQHVP